MKFFKLFEFEKKIQFIESFQNLWTFVYNRKKNKRFNTNEKLSFYYLDKYK
jgi:hypothetical protein